MFSLKRISLIGIIMAGVLALTGILLAQVGRVNAGRGETAAQPAADTNVHLPVILNGYPSDQFTHVELEASSTESQAGQPVSVTVRTLNDFDEPVHDSFFDVYVEINGRSQHDGDRLPLTSHQDGTYTGVFTPTATGTYYLSVVIIDTEIPDKLPQSDVTTVDVVPTEIIALDLASVEPADLTLVGRDQYGNPVPNMAPGSVNCTSDNPDLMPTPPITDSEYPEWYLHVGVAATDYGTAQFTCDRTPTANASSSNAPAADGVTATVAHLPWDLPMETDTADPGKGFHPDSFFDVFVEISPPGDGAGWGMVSGTLEVPPIPGLEIADCQATLADFEGVCQTVPDSSPTHTVEFIGQYIGSGNGFTETARAFQLTISTPVTVAAPAPGSIEMTDFNLYDPVLQPLYTAPLIDLPHDFILFPFAIKPTKTLEMHVYIVEGAATNADVVEDLEMLEGGFNLNALICTCGFYVDIDLITTTISITDWQSIDEDGNGLDREDLNGDGDYDDKGEHSDLENAKDEGFFDDGADTENVYYVPGITGGALGVTYAPDGQMAVDNDADHDNWTLMHEKVHELDLRKDGDFDVNDSPDDVGNAQGARDPGNAMNYGDMGPFLSEDQCKELD